MSKVASTSPRANGGGRLKPSVHGSRTSTQTGPVRVSEQRIRMPPWLTQTTSASRCSATRTVWDDTGTIAPQPETERPQTAAAQSAQVNGRSNRTRADSRSWKSCIAFLQIMVLPTDLAAESGSSCALSCTRAAGLRARFRIGPGPHAHPARPSGLSIQPTRRWCAVREG